MPINEGQICFMLSDPLIEQFLLFLKRCGYVAVVHCQIRPINDPGDDLARDLVSHFYRDAHDVLLVAFRPAVALVSASALDAYAVHASVACTGALWVT